MNQPAKPWPAMSIAQAHQMLTAPGSPLEMDEAVIRGVRTRVWKNAPPTLRDLLMLGRAHGDKIFLVYENDRASFEAFTRASLAIAPNEGTVGRPWRSPKGSSNVSVAWRAE